MDLNLLIPLAIAIVIVAGFSSLKSGKKAERDDYDSRGGLLTPAELAFYQVLIVSVPDNLTVMSKVRISDLLVVRRGLDRSRRQVAQNRINAKHVDFVLCNSPDMSIAAAIELDDSSHNRKDRKSRDVFVDSAFRSSGIPLIRFKARRQYDVVEVSEIISSSLRDHGALAGADSSITEVGDNLEIESSSEPVKQGNEDVSPICPVCQSKMVLRMGKRGERKGKEFWGCANYPKCRSVVPVT